MGSVNPKNRNLNMSLDSLIKEAADEAPHLGRVSTAPIMPVVHSLRSKGFTFDAIYDWLKSRGVHLPAKRSTFRANVSRRYRKFLIEKTEGVK
jgi:hypothetical protein